MQTFLPYNDFKKSAQVLDRARLFRQIQEAKTIHKANTIGNGWWGHPASRMWKGYETALLNYGKAMCEEWKARGFKPFSDYFDNELAKINDEDYELPPWFGNEKFHTAHRGKLLSKKHEHYSQFGWTESGKEKYVWPMRVFKKKLWFWDMDAKEDFMYVVEDGSERRIIEGT